MMDLVLWSSGVALTPMILGIGSSILDSTSDYFRKPSQGLSQWDRNSWHPTDFDRLDVESSEESNRGY